MAPIAAPELTDGTVFLRPYRPDDADAVVDALQDPEIPRWVASIPAGYTHEHFDRWRREAEAQAAEGRGVHLLVLDRDGTVCGAVGLNDIDTGRADIGYWLAREARGKGHAARAGRLLRDWAHSELGLERIEILAHPDNEASQHVALAAGFHRTGEYRPCGRCGDSTDYVVFAWPEDGGAGAGAG